MFKFKMGSLTNKEAQEILDVCEGTGTCWVKRVQTEPEYDADGGVRVTFGGELGIGIVYGREKDINNDSYLLSFDEPKVREWLDAHNFEARDYYKEVNERRGFKT